MIVKLQQGGGLPPYQYYRPVTVTTPSGTVAQPERATRASGASNKSNDLTDKDILKSLDKIDGLPSDMTVLQSGLISALNSDSGFSLSIGRLVVGIRGVALGVFRSDLWSTTLFNGWSL